jgi:hypothetical protein
MATSSSKVEAAITEIERIEAELAAAMAELAAEKNTGQEQLTMSTNSAWVAYDAISGDVLADGSERLIRRYVQQDYCGDTVIAVPEANWRHAVEGIRRRMSGNPPRRYPAGLIHLSGQGQP